MREIHTFARQVWLVYSSPTRNVASRDVIGWASEPTLDTFENFLRGSVRLVYVPASGTHSTGIPWINIDHRHTHESSFVVHECYELSKCPTVQCCALRPPNPYPFADALKVFKSDTTIGAFGLRNKLFTNAVIYVLRHPVFLTRAMPQESLGSARSLPLKLPAQPAVTTTQTIQLCTCIEHTIGIGSDIDDAKINSEKSGRIVCLRRIGHNTDQEIEVFPTIHEVAFAMLTTKQRSLPFATHERHRLATVNRPDRHTVLTNLQYSAIEANRTSRSETMLNISSASVAGRDSTNCQTCSIGRECKALARFVVHNVMQIEASVSTRFVSTSANPISSSIAFCKRTMQRVALFRSRLQLDLDRKMHKLKVTALAQFPRRLKTDGPPCEGPMEVTRLVHIEDKGYVLEVKTKHQSIQIYVTEKGRKIKAYPIRGLHGSR